MAQTRPTPQVPNSCSGPVSSSFNTLAPTDFISPDALMHVTGQSIPKGVDRKPSGRLIFDVTNTYGTFEIDTCCATPANHIGFVDLDVNFITPNFIKGVVTIVCPECCIGDPQCDGVQSNVQDVVAAINVAFRSLAPTQGPGCPAEQSDVDCSGATDISDVVKVIDVAFRSANPATRFCNPCNP